MLLNNQHITEEIRKEMKICIETNKNGNMIIQNLWGSESCAKGKNESSDIGK